jgi:hypothetical protein
MGAMACSTSSQVWSRGDRGFDAISWCALTLPLPKHSTAAAQDEFTSGPDAGAANGSAGGHWKTASSGGRSVEIVDDPARGASKGQLPLVASQFLAWSAGPASGGALGCRRQGCRRCRPCVLASRLDPLMVACNGLAMVGTLIALGRGRDGDEALSAIEPQVEVPMGQVGSISRDRC